MDISFQTKSLGDRNSPQSPGQIQVRQAIGNLGQMIKTMLKDLDEALEFLKNFHGPIIDQLQTFNAADDSIPHPLRKVYATFGDPKGKAAPINVQDSLAAPDELKRQGDYIHFLSENQGCWSCAYAVDGSDDPPVYLFGDDDRPEKQSDSLGEFLVTYLLAESVLAAPNLAWQEDGIEAADALKTPCEPLWLDAIYAQPNPTHCFYWSSEPGILAMRFDGDYAPWLWLGSYEDHWENVLRPCDAGYSIQDGAGNERRWGSTQKNLPQKKRWPKWLRWLE